MVSSVFKALLLLLCLKITEAIFFTSRVDCLVTEWSPWSAPNSAGKQTRIRRIMRHPRNGGKPCPHLNETRSSFNICKVTPWSPWGPNFGFGQQSRLRSVVTHPGAGQKCSQKLEEVRYTGKVPSVAETAKNVQTFFMRPNGPAPLSKSTLNNNADAALPRDLVLILDSSGSIRSVPFAVAKDQLSRLIGLLCPIPPFDKIVGSPYQYNQAAMLTYSSTVVENFNFNSYDTTVKIQHAILKARYEGRSTYTHLAFDRARGLFVPSKGVRDAARAKREVLILTDGRSSYKSKTLEAVEKLRKEADVYGLMIGNFTTYGMQELTDYVSSPINKHLFYLKDFNELKQLVDLIESWKNLLGDSWCAPFNPNP